MPRGTTAGLTPARSWSLLTTIHRGLVVICLASAVMLGGCVSQPHDLSQARPAAPQPSGQMQITLGGDGLNLGEIQQVTLRPDKLGDIVAKLLAEQRYESAREWVRRYPDVALDLLRNSSAETAANPAEQFIARQYDRQCAPGADSGWAGVLTDRIQHAATHHQFQDDRARVLAAIRIGHLDEAASIKLVDAVPSTSPGNFLRIEALRLHGVALLLHEDNAKAADAFEQAADLAQHESPYQAAHHLLMASDASRRAGRADTADQQWRQAVTLVASLLHQPATVNDPVLWERAIYLHPHDKAWPTAVIQPLISALTDDPLRMWQSDTAATGSTDTNAATRLIWSNVGLWHLARQEPQSAMVAFQRAEVLADTDAQRDELRLQQSRALAQLGQDTAAMSMLVSLMNKPTAVGRSALAVAGVISIKQDQVQRGLSLLRRAVENNQLHSWPGRIKAQIDLGQAYLIVGDEANGFTCLHRAQNELTDQDAEILIKSLQNERRYLEAVDKDKDRIAEIDQRLQSLERLATH